MNPAFLKNFGANIGKYKIQILGGPLWLRSDEKMKYYEFASPAWATKNS
jgi:hypothetical protein